MNTDELETWKKDVLVELSDMFLGANTPKTHNFVYEQVVKEIGYDPTKNEEDPRYDEYWNRSTQLIRKLFVEFLVQIGPYDGVIELVEIPTLNNEQ